MTSVAVRPGAGGRLWPRRDYYWELLPDRLEAHPIDVLIDRAPAVRKLGRQVLRLQRGVAAGVSDKTRWVRYADARITLQSLREEFAFNLGVEFGAVSARTEALRPHARRSPETPGERAFRKAARGLLAAGDVPAERRLAVLLEMAWALAMGSPRPPLVGRDARRRTGAAGRQS